MDVVLEVLDRTFLGNSLRDYLAAVLFVLLAVLVARIVRTHLGRLLGRLTKLTHTRFDDRLAEGSVGPLSSMIILAGLHFAVLVLEMPGGLRTTLRRSLAIAFAVLVTLVALRALDALFSEVVEPWSRRTASKLDDQLIRFGRKLGKIVILVFAAAIVLEHVGLNIMSLVTGLGIGGLAVALAAQETLGNVLGSLQILTDQPFAIGDWIRVSGHFGKVHDIGLRSTKIMTRSRILVVVPNKRIAESAVENLTVGDDLAVDLDLGLVYGTTADQIERAIEIINEVLAERDDLLDSRLTHFLEFADFALVLRCTYFVHDIPRYWDVQHEVNLAIKRRFDAEGLDFAFPTRTVHLVQETSGASGAG